MAFADIPIRVDGQHIADSWFNTLRTQGVGLETIVSTLSAGTGVIFGNLRLTFDDTSNVVTLRDTASNQELTIDLSALAGSGTGTPFDPSAYELHLDGTTVQMRDSAAPNTVRWSVDLSTIVGMGGFDSSTHELHLDGTTLQMRLAAAPNTVVWSVDLSSLGGTGGFDASTHQLNLNGTTLEMRLTAAPNTVVWSVDLATLRGLDASTHQLHLNGTTLEMRLTAAPNTVVWSVDLASLSGLDASTHQLHLNGTTLQMRLTAAPNTVVWSVDLATLQFDSTDYQLHLDGTTLQVRDSAAPNTVRWSVDLASLQFDTTLYEFHITGTTLQLRLAATPNTVIWSADIEDAIRNISLTGNQKYDFISRIWAPNPPANGVAVINDLGTEPAFNTTLLGDVTDLQTGKEDKFIYGTRNPNRFPAIIGRGNTTAANDTAVLSTSASLSFAGLVAVTHLGTDAITRNIRATQNGSDVPIFFTFHYDTATGDYTNHLYWPETVTGGNDVNNYPVSFDIQTLANDNSVIATFSYNRNAVPSNVPDSTYNVGGATLDAYSLDYRFVGTAGETLTQGASFRIINFTAGSGANAIDIDDSAVPPVGGNVGQEYRQRTSSTDRKIIRYWQQVGTLSNPVWAINDEGGTPADLSALETRVQTNEDDIGRLDTSVTTLPGAVSSNSATKLNRTMDNISPAAAITPASRTDVLTSILSTVNATQREDIALWMLGNASQVEKAAILNHFVGGTAGAALQSVRRNFTNNGLEYFDAVGGDLANVNVGQIPTMIIDLLRDRLGINVSPGNLIVGAFDPNKAPGQGASEIFRSQAGFPVFSTTDQIASIGAGMRAPSTPAVINITAMRGSSSITVIIEAYHINTAYFHVPVGTPASALPVSFVATIDGVQYTYTNRNLSLRPTQYNDGTTNISQLYQVYDISPDAPSDAVQLEDLEFVAGSHASPMNLGVARTGQDTLSPLIADGGTLFAQLNAARTRLLGIWQNMGTRLLPDWVLISSVPIEIVGENPNTLHRAFTPSAPLAVDGSTTNFQFLNTSALTSLESREATDPSRNISVKYKGRELTYSALERVGTTWYFWGDKEITYDETDAPSSITLTPTDGTDAIVIVRGTVTFHSVTYRGATVTLVPRWTYSGDAPDADKEYNITSADANISVSSTEIISYFDRPNGTLALNRKNRRVYEANHVSSDFSPATIQVNTDDADVRAVSSSTEIINTLVSLERQNTFTQDNLISILNQRGDNIIGFLHDLRGQLWLAVEGTHHSRPDSITVTKNGSNITYSATGTSGTRTIVTANDDGSFNIIPAASYHYGSTSGDRWADGESITALSSEGGTISLQLRGRDAHISWEDVTPGPTFGTEDPNSLITTAEVDDPIPELPSHASGGSAELVFLNDGRITSFDGAAGTRSTITNPTRSFSVKYNGTETRNGIFIKYDNNTYVLYVGISGHTAVDSDFPDRFRAYANDGTHTLFTGPTAIAPLRNVIRGGTLETAQAATYHRSYGPDIQADKVYTFVQLESDNPDATIVVSSLATTHVIREGFLGEEGQDFIDEEDKRYYVRRTNRNGIPYWKDLTPIPKFLDESPNNPLLGAKPYVSTGDEPAHFFLIDSYTMDDIDEISIEIGRHETYNMKPGQEYAPTKRLRTQAPGWAGLHIILVHSYNATLRRAEIDLVYNEQERTFDEITDSVIYDDSTGITFTVNSDEENLSAHFGRLGRDTTSASLTFIHLGEDGNAISINSYEEYVARYQPHLPKRLYSSNQNVHQFFSPPINPFFGFHYKTGDVLIHPDDNGDYIESVKRDDGELVDVGRSNLIYTTESEQGVNVIQRFHASGTTLTNGFRGRYLAVADPAFMIFAGAVMGTDFILRDTTYRGSGTVLQNQQAVPSGYTSNFNIIKTDADGTIRALPCALLFNRGAGGTPGIVGITLLLATDGINDDTHDFWQLVQGLKIYQGNSSKTAPVRQRDFRAGPQPGGFSYNIDSDLEGEPEEAIEITFTLDSPGNDITGLNLAGTSRELAFEIVISEEEVTVDGMLSSLRFDKTTGEALAEVVSREVKRGELHFDESAERLHLGTSRRWLHLPLDIPPTVIENTSTRHVVVPHYSKTFIGDTRRSSHTINFNFDELIKDGAYQFDIGATWKFIRWGDLWVERVTTSSHTDRWINKDSHGWLTGQLLHANHTVGTASANTDIWVSQAEKDRFKLTDNFANIHSENDNDFLDPSNLTDNTTFTPQKGYMHVNGVPGYESIGMDYDGQELTVRHLGERKFHCEFTKYSGWRQFSYVTGGLHLAHLADVSGKYLHRNGELEFIISGRVTTNETNTLDQLSNHGLAIPFGLSIDSSFDDTFIANPTATVSNRGVALSLGTMFYQLPGNAGHQLKADLRIGSHAKNRIVPYRVTGGDYDGQADLDLTAHTIAANQTVDFHFRLPINLLQRK